VLHGRLWDWLNGLDTHFDVFDEVEPTPAMTISSGHPRGAYTHRRQEMQQTEPKWHGPLKYGRPTVPVVDTAYLLCKCGETALTGESMHLHYKTSECENTYTLITYNEQRVEQIRAARQLYLETANTWQREH
jgi:hypothetical protein